MNTSTTPETNQTVLSHAGERWLAQPRTDVGPATPPPAWCLPNAIAEWGVMSNEYGGGGVCTWTRTFPAESPAADVWITADDITIDGRVLRTEPRIKMFEPNDEGSTAEEARKLAAELLNAADVLDHAKS